MVRLKDVAREAHVSPATASLVLAHKAQGRVSEATRRRVRKAAEDLDYVGNAAARTLRTKQTKTIGFLSDRIASTPYAVKMIEAANRVALDSGRLLLLINTEGDEDNVERAVRVLNEHRVQETIVASMFHREVKVHEKLSSDVVVLDGFTVDSTVPSIVPDEVQGARAVMRMLIDAGHRRIGYLGETRREGEAAVLRKRAYLDVLTEEGGVLDPDLVVDTRSRPDVAVANATKLIIEGKPTAIFCFNDVRARSVYHAARNLGLRIPEDLSVVGFDNQEMIAPLLDPPLTTVQLPHAEMAEWAVRTALSAEKPAPPEGGYPVRQECRIVFRDSVGPAPLATEQLSE